MFFMLPLLLLEHTGHVANMFFMLPLLLLALSKQSVSLVKTMFSISCLGLVDLPLVSVSCLRRSIALSLIVMALKVLLVLHLHHIVLIHFVVIAIHFFH